MSLNVSLPINKRMTMTWCDIKEEKPFYPFFVKIWFDISVDASLQELVQKGQNIINSLHIENRDIFNCHTATLLINEINNCNDHSTSVICENDNGWTIQDRLNLIQLINNK